eukprot:1137298-Pelagomonas_calceolata.AAC.8
MWSTHTDACGSIGDKKVQFAVVAGVADVATARQVAVLLPLIDTLMFTPATRSHLYHLFPACARAGYSWCCVCSPQTCRAPPLVLSGCADVVEIKHVLLPPDPRTFKDIYVVFELMESDLHTVIEANDDLTHDHHKAWSLDGHKEAPTTTGPQLACGCSSHSAAVH